MSAATVVSMRQGTACALVGRPSEPTTASAAMAVKAFTPINFPVIFIEPPEVVGLTTTPNYSRFNASLQVIENKCDISFVKNF
jgi:hypothetical protein